jgi:hypothetical protein
VALGLPPAAPITRPASSASGWLATVKGLFDQALYFSIALGMSSGLSFWQCGASGR